MQLTSNRVQSFKRVQADLLLSLLQMSRVQIPNRITRPRITAERAAV